MPSLGRANTPPVRSFGPWDWFFAFALVLAVLLVYQPAWHGGFLWDDDAHVTRPELRSWQGLHDIWFDVRATLQYYPLVHSAFWLQHALWGDDTLGYHLVNIFLHATAALMAARSCAACRSRELTWRRRSSPCTRCRWNRWPGSRNSRTRSRLYSIWGPRRSTSASTSRGRLVGTSLPWGYSRWPWRARP